MPARTTIVPENKTTPVELPPRNCCSAFSRPQQVDVFQVPTNSIFEPHTALTPSRCGLGFVK